MADIESSASFYSDREEFSRALSLSRAAPNSTQGIWQPWAYFRLGMYETVSSLDIDPCNLQYAERQLLPAVISHAAVGKSDLVKCLLKDAPWVRLPHHLRIGVAKHLSSYMPQDALRLIDALGKEVPVVVYVLILLRAGHKNLAREMVEQALKNITDRSDFYSILHLYRTITEEMSPLQQLNSVNKTYLAYGLPELALRDRNFPLNPCNVYSSTGHVFSDGPLVSVLMTTFNVEGRVSAAIESILRQSYRQLELIVVDDLSTDETAREIQDWADRDARVSFIKLDRNVGTYCAKSVGLKHAGGEFVTCMDADDWSHPMKLELQMYPLLQDDSLVATTSNWIRVSDIGVVDTLERVDLVHLNYSSLLFRKEKIVTEIGVWDLCARTGADVEFIRRIALAYGPFAVKNISAPLSLASRRGDSLTMADDGTGFLGGEFPPELLKYIEAFNRWHINTLKSNRNPKMDVSWIDWVKDHPFAFPSKVFSDVNDVIAVLRS
ncbi:glycosyltransferase family 2 protein [Castellaniella hirudinis]|uniref:glycosyltransferase family 2 protein n=1 Tax=Castellaniella hirudinis TaxID=1144617 RepID=UPI0039C0C897